MARLGGDEFTVLLDGLSDAAEAERGAASIDVGLAEPGKAVVPADLLRDVDVAMYRAKARGKARYELFEPAMGASLRERVALRPNSGGRSSGGSWGWPTSQLSSWPPAVSWRWRPWREWERPGNGPVPPGDFIPMDEETALIVPLRS